MSLKEKQAAAKQTFVFHKPLTNEPSVEQTAERVSAGFMSKKRLVSRHRRKNQ